MAKSKKKPKTIVTAHKPNFNTLIEAFKNNDVCLMDCIEKATGEHVAVICIVTYDRASKEYTTIPYAKFFNGNPFELLIPPMDYEDINTGDNNAASHSPASTDNV